MSRVPTHALSVIDLRAITWSDERAMAHVRSAVAELEPDGMLELVVPREPRSLLDALREAGCEARSTPEPDGSWSVQIGRPRLQAFADLSSLPAPEPLERLLEAVVGLRAGEVLVARLPRDPVLAKPHLEARGVAWRVRLRPDGTALVWIRR